MMRLAAGAATCRKQPPQRKRGKHMSAYAGMTSRELLSELAALGEEHVDRLVTYLEVAQDSPDAADEGLLLATKTQKVLSTFSHRFSLDGERPSLWELERRLKEVACSA